MELRVSSWGGELRSGSNQHKFRMWAGFSKGGGSGRPQGWGMASRMALQLGPHELQHVFSFLEARDLLRAAQVNKVRSQAGSPHRRVPPAPGRRASPPGIGLAGGLGWPRPTLPVHFVDHAPVLVVICP